MRPYWALLVGAIIGALVILDRYEGYPPWQAGQLALLFLIASALWVIAHKK